MPESGMEDMVAGGGRDERLMSLMDLALALPEEQCDAYLRHACAGDQALYAEVSERIHWERKMNGFLREPLIPRAEHVEPFQPEELILERFEIIRKAGEGGMAVVYEAFDRRLEQRIAIKCPKAGYRRRLPPELRSALKVTHRNVCRLYDIYSAKTASGEAEFITMELLPGETLHERMRRGRLDPSTATHIAGQICAGLAEAHTRGIIHGDLKPTNIILTTEGDGSVRAAITDFGLAQPVAGLGGLAATSAGVGTKNRLRGTPDFIAPELWKGAPLTVQSDLYALGVILYEIVTGDRPFAGQPPEARFDALPAPPNRWDSVILQCLAPDPAKRPPSAAAVAAALSPPVAETKVKPWAAAAALVAAMAAGGAWVHSQTATLAAPVRLAVLDLASDPDSTVIARGVMVDFSERLKRLGDGRNRLVVIPVADSARDNVRTPEQAAALLGATHAVTGSLRAAGDGLSARVQVWDIGQRQKLNEFSHEYARAEIATLPRALVGAVSTALRLHASAALETVNQAAYADYVEGTYFLHRDLESADQAIAALERAIKADPASALPWAALAEAQILKSTKAPERESWMQKARESAAQAAARNPDATEVLLVTGHLKNLSGDSSGALADYRRALERSPGDGEVQRRLAQAYEDAGMRAEAVRTYKAAIDTQPGFFRPYLNLGNYHLAQSNFEEAARNYQEAVKLTPQRRAGHYNLGIALLEAGRLDQAETEFQIALGSSEDWGPLLGLASVRTFQRRFPESVELCERARKAGPNTAIVLLNLADAYVRAGRIAEAAPVFRQAAALADRELMAKPNDPYRRVVLGYLAARAGDSSRARSEVQQAVAVAGDRYHVAVLAAITLEHLGLRGDTLQLLQRASKPVLARLSRQPELSDLQSDRRFIQVSQSAN